MTCLVQAPFEAALGILSCLLLSNVVQQHFWLVIGHPSCGIGLTEPM